MQFCHVPDTRPAALLLILPALLIVTGLILAPSGGLQNLSIGIGVLGLLFGAGWLFVRQLMRLEPEGTPHAKNQPQPQQTVNDGD